MCPILSDVNLHNIVLRGQLFGLHDEWMGVVNQEKMGGGGHFVHLSLVRMASQGDHRSFELNSTASLYEDVIRRCFYFVFKCHLSV